MANEMFAISLGLWLGLAMPPVAAIEVSDWLIDNTPELHIELAGSQVPCSSGLQLGSRYPCDPATDPMDIFDYLPESHMAKSNQSLSFARVLVLDKCFATQTAGKQSSCENAGHVISTLSLSITDTV